MTEEKKHLTLADVLDQQEAVHQRLLASSRPSPLTSSAGRVGYAHYPLHARAIERWRKHRR